MSNFVCFLCFFRGFNSVCTINEATIAACKRMALTLRPIIPLIAALLCSRLFIETPWYWLCFPTSEGPSFSMTERTCLTVGSADVATASVSCTLRYMIWYCESVLSTFSTCWIMLIWFVVWVSKESCLAGSRMSTYIAHFRSTDPCAMRFLFPL